MKRLWQFILDSYRELRFNVTWPSRKEVGGTTVVVLVMVAVVSLFLFLVDSGIHYAIRRVMLYFAGS